MGISVSMYFVFFLEPIWKPDGFVFDWVTGWYLSFARSRQWHVAGCESCNWTTLICSICWMQLGTEGIRTGTGYYRHQQSRLGPKDTMGTLHYRWRWFRGWQPYMKIDFNRILAKWSEQHWLRSGSFRNAVHLLQERCLIHVALRRHQCQRFSGYAIGRAGGETWGIGMGCKLV